jgi:hypothetical protein
MKNVKDLELYEMVSISGGINLAYEIGYAAGKLLRNILLARAIVNLPKM